MQPFAPTSSIPSRGFTLIELLVVLSIILLLGGPALHGITKQTASQRMDGLQKTFITFLLSARKAAVMQHVDVIVLGLQNVRFRLGTLGFFIVRWFSMVGWFAVF